MKIGLIPLDERPVNTRYPAMIAAIAGVEVVLPPRKYLSRYRTPASSDDLTHWLRETPLDGLIVSVEMLGYGGLIASRITHEPVAAIVRRLDILRELKTPIYGFNLIMRIPDYDFNVEEPDYWLHYGVKIHHYSRYYDMASKGLETPDLDMLRREIPQEHLDDFMTRRLRNHTVNMTVISMALDGTFDQLVLSSDDTSVYGLGTREKSWIADWMSRLPLHEQILMYPGADEVGCALLARFLNTSPVRIHVHYAIPEDANITAPYEDGPVHVTVDRQIRAVNGLKTDTDYDFVLAVNPPSPIGREFDPERAAQERQARLPYLESFIERIKQWIEEGKQVMIADVGYPNGSDPLLIQLLRDQIDVTALAGYGAWNTAGNTIGTVLAQGIAASRIKSDEQRMAHHRFLLHRFIEDWGYQHLVRDEVRDWLESQTGLRDTSADNIDAARAFIEERLQTLIDELPQFAGKWRIVPGSVWLPWNRTFEVDFELELL